MTTFRKAEADAMCTFGQCGRKHASMNRVNTLRKQVESDKSGQVAVFGSCFLDYIGYVSEIPAPGQTLASESFAKGFGGKGANQAVMAGRLGAKTRMIAMVGDDGDGSDYIANFTRNGIDTQFVDRVPQTSTGLALISVNVRTAENAIVICPNAAGKTTFEHFFSDSARDPLKNCMVLICQNEVPLQATLKALRFAHGRGLYTIFNTAPAPSPQQVQEMSPFLQYVSLLCPNEHEAAIMTGITVDGHESAVKAAKAIQSMGVKNVVITLGKNGATVLEGTKATHVAGIKVNAVDTTGAGDAFVGALAYFVSVGDTLETACRKANQCAAISVTRRGTQTSYPLRSELPSSLFESK